MALPALDAVWETNRELAVMSQPDKPVGRKKILTPTPVSQWALDRGVLLYRPLDHDGIQRAVSEFSPDLGITVAYGRILRPTVLDVPRHGWWNLHFSLLPRWRGAAPVQHALLAGDTTTGVSVFRLNEGVDTGPLLGQVSHPITPGITAGDLLTELSYLGATLLAQAVEQLATGGVTEAEQSGDVSHAPKLERDTGRICASDPLDVALRRFQATTPEPGCYVTWGRPDKSLRILAANAMYDAASPGDGAIHTVSGGVGIALAGGYLMLESVQPAGKKAMSSTDWWRGVHGDVAIDG